VNRFKLEFFRSIFFAIKYEEMEIQSVVVFVES